MTKRAPFLLNGGRWFANSGHSLGNRLSHKYVGEDAPAMAALLAHG